MSDPAIEAAQRAWHPNLKLYTESEWEHGVASARAALQPIRDVLERWDRNGNNLALSPQARAILDAIKPLIYSSEELSQ